MIAELLGGKKNSNAGSYNREDCRRWSERFAIPMSYPEPNVFYERAKNWGAASFDREELPARAFCAADPGRRDLLDQALFEAAWVAGLDVNEPATIGWAAERAGLDPERLLTELAGPGPAREVRNALAEFERLDAPAYRPWSSTASASLERTGSIGSPIFAAPKGELWVLIATGYPRPRNHPHNFSSVRPACARRDCRAALAMTLPCHC